MPDNELQIKGWPAAILAVLLVLGGGGYLIAIPGRLHPAERRAIVDYLRNERSSGLAASVENLKQDIDNKAQLEETLALGRESLKKIEVTSELVPPRGLSTGKRVKITYTVGGETPKEDGGVRYFHIRNHKGGATRHNYTVYEITRERFKSWW